MKSKIKTLTTFGITLFTAAFLSHEASGQTFTNGSFELPGGVPLDDGIGLSPGDPRLVGWTIGGLPGQFVSYNNGSPPHAGILFPPPVDGTYHLGFNGGDTAPGTWIAQTFDTVIGDVYEVSFHVGRLGPGAGTVRLDARVLAADGQMITNRVAVPPAQGYGGVQRFTFTATSSRTTLQFLDTSLATVSVDVLLDAISVTSLRARLTIEVSEVAICWVGSTNHMYQVQYRSDLTTNLWADFGLAAQGTGAEVCVRDAMFRQPRRFYQVLTLP